MAPGRARLAFNLLISVGFVALLWAPVLDAIFSLDPSPERDERRTLRTRPTLGFDAHSLASYPGDFDAFYGDRMGFRSSLIRWNNYIEVTWLDTIPDVGEPGDLPVGTPIAARRGGRGKQVVLGVDGWFFYGGEGALDDYRGLGSLKNRELAEWRREFEARRDWLRERDAEYLLLIAPNKESIYSEFMPKNIRKIGSVSRLDQILSYLGERSDLIIVNPMPHLREARASERVYARTDTHWNDVGAHIAYLDLMEALQALFPAIEAHDRSWFRVRTEFGRGGDLASLLGISESLSEEKITLQRKQMAGARRTQVNVLSSLEADSPPFAMTGTTSQISRAVVFSDSFGLVLVPFLSEHFGRIVFYEGTGFLKYVVLHERPQVVIEVMAERSFVQSPPLGFRQAAKPVH